MPSEIETAFASRPVAKLEYTRAESLVASYRFHRQTPFRKRDGKGRLLTSKASSALASARDDVAKNVRRYPSRGSAWNPRLEAYGEKHMRWIENPAACGLRFVGYADKLDRSIRHTGHFTRTDQSDPIRGAVFQLPGRDGKPLFVGGYDDPDNGAADSNGPVLLSFDVSEGERGDYWSNDARENDGARTAASWADQIAERAAEEQRNHDAAYCAGQRYAELGNEIAQSRSEIRQAIQQFKRARTVMQGLGESGAYTRLCEIIRGDVANELESIRQARAERAKLKGGEYVRDWIPGFWTGDDALRASFNDGAAIASNP